MNKLLVGTFGAQITALDTLGMIKEYMTRNPDTNIDNLRCDQIDYVDGNFVDGEKGHLMVVIIGIDEYAVKELSEKLSNLVPGGRYNTEDVYETMIETLSQEGCIIERDDECFDSLTEISLP